MEMTVINLLSSWPVSYVYHLLPIVLYYHVLNYLSPSFVCLSVVKMWTSRLRPRSNKSSLYTPVAAPPSPLPPSPSPPRDNSKNTRDKKSKSSDALSASKRRSTMNSRDAAYDEEELLRRAIEESKGQDKSTVEGSGSKKSKRTRSDSEVYVLIFLALLPQQSFL